jgi:hypothetical protein
MNTITGIPFSPLLRLWLSNRVFNLFQPAVVGSWIRRSNLQRDCVTDTTG